MNISYEHYRIFYYVAKLQSFTQAAGVLMNSQPNITRSIKNLEQELGCPLFTRSNRQVQLTPEGEALYRHVSIAFDQLQAGEEEIRFGKGLHGDEQGGKQMNQENQTFEASMARLEQIVRAMERGDVALEESLKLFQEGTELVRNCQKLLDEAQLQIKKIMTAPDGSPVEEVFQDEP